MNIPVQVFLYIFLAHFDNKKWPNSFSKRYAIFKNFHKNCMRIPIVLYSYQCLEFMLKKF